MPAKAIALSSSIGDLLRHRRQHLGYTLREVEQLSSDKGNLIPFSTLARIEQGRLDPGLKRLNLLLSLYGLPIQAAGDLLDLEAMAGAVPAKRDVASLRDKGTEAWQKGDHATAIACYMAMRRHASDSETDRDVRHESILSFAVMAAKLGKHHIARQMLDDLLLDKPSRPMLIRIFVQAATTWQALGSPETGLALIGGAEALIEPGDLRGRGWVSHVRAAIQIELREFDDAHANLAEATRVFQKGRRPYDRALALVAMARLEVERGDAQAASRAARQAAKFATLKRFPRVEALASIQEARALLLAGKPETALAVLTRVLAATVASSDDVVRFYSHFYLSKAYAHMKDPLRAHVELEQARYFVKFLDQASKEAKEVREHFEARRTAPAR